MSNSSQRKLTQLRRSVESLDKKIIILLAKRFRLTRQIQIVKKALNMPLHQKKREQTLLHIYKAAGKRKSLSPLFIQKVFTLLFSYAKKNGKIK